MTYKYKGKLNPHAKIVCPIHRLQKTYELFDKNKNYFGIGCYKCFEKLSYYSVENDKKEKSEKSKSG